MEMTTQSNLGTSKDGLPIVARACGEDASGIVVALPSGRFALRLNYGYVERYASRDDAIEGLRFACGEHGLN